MPCYDGRDSVQIRTVYESGISPEKLESANRNIKQLEAALCAVCNELDRRGIAENVLSEASRNGLIDLMQFYSSHKKEDVARLANDIHKRYSKDELAVIKKLIDSQM